MPQIIWRCIFVVYTQIGWFYFVTLCPKHKGNGKNMNDITMIGEEMFIVIVLTFD